MSTSSDSTILDAPTNPGCGCPACMSGETNSTTYQINNFQDVILASELDSDASGSMGNANLLNTGREWGPGGGVGVEVTFSFLTAPPSYVNQYYPYEGEIYEDNAFLEFTNTMKTAAREILETVENFTNLTFREVDPDTEGVGDITWAMADLPPGIGGWAYYPDQGVTSGDIYVDRYAVNPNSVPEGSYGHFVLIHELGHALGLQHTWDAFSLSTYDSDPINTEQFSVMAYNTSPWGSRYAESFMLYDIAALQQVYGANNSYNSGDTTYTLENNAAKTLWDGGGTDTLDGSHLSNGIDLDLRDASFSSIGNTNNFAIAYNTGIENANSGDGNDTIIGNELDNVINANAGSDTIYASTGSDNLDGGDGNDTIEYSFDLSDFLVSLIDSVSLSIEHVVQGFVDTLTNIETFIFNGISYDRTSLEAEANIVNQEILTRFSFDGSDFYYDTFGSVNETLTAAGLGYSGATGDIVSIERSGASQTITFENADAPGNMLVRGYDGNDDITISGSHNSLNLSFYGGGGDDTLTLNTIESSATLFGEAGNDTITVQDGRNYLFGDEGADTLNGGAGSDTIRGGIGDDELNGGGERDWIFGGEGEDEIFGDGGNDILRGGDNNDYVEGGEGVDKIYGNSGDDELFGQAGNDHIFGGSGDDTLNGGGGQDRIFGGIGNDTINGGEAADFLNGEDGEDEINGGASNDRITGGNGNDTLNGDGGSDYIWGNDGADTIYGGSSSDRLVGEAGDDTIYGEDGFDTLYGQSGHDTLDGGDRNDFLSGGSGNDILRGQAHNDDLYGDDGEDTLIGGHGADALYGGVDSSADVFGFSVDENSTDRIYNFVEGQDVLNITDILSGFSGTDITGFAELNHTGSRFDLRVDRDGGGDNYETIANIFTDISDTTTAQDLVDNGTLLTNQTLV